MYEAMMFQVYATRGTRQQERPAYSSGDARSGERAASTRLPTMKCCAEAAVLIELGNRLQPPDTQRQRAFFANQVVRATQYSSGNAVEICCQVGYTRSHVLANVATFDINDLMSNHRRQMVAESLSSVELCLSPRSASNHDAGRPNAPAPEAADGGGACETRKEES